MKSFKQVLSPPASRNVALIEEIVGYATTARRDGILALESAAPKATDPFLARALMLAVDGADSNQMRATLETTIEHAEEGGEDIAKVWEAIGGYAPTVGIIGAVLGLIQVMQNLSDIGKVGHGIASAFVATIYGVAIANLIALPCAGKMKIRTRDEVKTLTLVLEGALGIQQGVNPMVLRERLEGLAHDAKQGHGAKEGAPAGAASAAA
ncbi:MAG: MotA/TolQ/ExbB proton channel family protein [Polyangiaceae bacterium]